MTDETGKLVVYAILFFGAILPWLAGLIAVGLVAYAIASAIL